MSTLRANLAKQKLKAGQPVFGVSLPFPSPALVEVLGHAGFDFVLMDAEHASTNEEVCENMVRAAESVGIAPLIRVPLLTPALISRFLDTGLLGLQVAHVCSRTDAETILRAVKYYPQGWRGLSHSRAADYGLSIPIAEYIEQANKATLVVAMIEDAEAVDNLPEILTVDGIDVIFVGPGDLSQSLGLPGQYDHPVVTETVERIIDEVRGSDKVLGMPGNDAPTIERNLSLGAKYICGEATTLIAKAGWDLLAKVKGSQSSSASLVN